MLRLPGHAPREPDQHSFTEHSKLCLSEPEQRRPRGPGQQLDSNYPGNTGFTHYDQFDIRGDYNATSRDLIDARFSWRLLPLTVPALPGSGPARTEHCAGMESYDIALRV
jgi:hypothetical protein